MKRILLLSAAAAFCLTTSTTNAQYRADFGITLGAANYVGDMGGEEATRRDFVWDMKLDQSKAMVGAFYRYRFSHVFGINTKLTYGRLAGSDDLSTNPGRVGRNLSFRNDLVELSTRGEWYFYRHNDLGRHFRYTTKLKAYFFGGVAAFYHNPQAQYEGKWHNLRPLMTEGQDKPYSNINFSIPAGFGFYITHNRRYRFGWEIGWRTTFTDYLDDVSTTYANPEDLSSDLARALANRTNELEDLSTVPGVANYDAGEKRGDSSHNDTYLFTGFSFSYVLRGHKWDPRDEWKKKRRRWIKIGHPKWQGTTPF
jgi:hypothetical protein